MFYRSVDSNIKTTYKAKFIIDINSIIIEDKFKK